MDSKKDSGIGLRELGAWFSDLGDRESLRRLIEGELEQWLGETLAA